MKENMKSMWLIIVLITMSGLALAQDCKDDDCCSKDFPNWSNYDQVYTNINKISINFTGTIVKLQMENIVDINTITNNKYINANFNSDEQILYIDTTEDYKIYYEKETSTTIDLQIEFKCRNSFTKPLIFSQGINNTNIFSPKFSKAIYDFKIPLPLQPGTDLNKYQEISAIDYDITYYKITFFSNDSGIIDIKNDINKINEKKTYYASLTLTKFLSSIDDKLEFMIYAKDNGSPTSLISSAKIIISANIAESSPPQPRFHQIIYHGQLNDDYELTMFKTVELFIGTYSEDVSFTKSGIDENLFNIIPEQNLVNIELSRTITPDDLKNKTFLQFEINAANKKLNEIGQTGVIVKFPIELSKLYFEKTIYNGKISNDEKLELEDEIQLIGKIDNNEKLTFVLSGNDSEYFNYIADGNVVKIQLNDNVSSNELNERKFLSIIVIAELNNVTITSTAVIIDIVKETDLFFSKSMYEGIFYDFNNFTIENITLLEISYTNTVKFDLEGTDSEYFNYIQENNIIKINLAKSIYPDEWKFKKFLSFFIKAKKSKVSDQTAGILIRLLDQKLEIPEFKKSLYNGKIISTDNMELEKINLINPIEKLQYYLTGNETDYFKFDENENQILIKTTIPDDILQNKSFLYLTLIAKTEDNVKNFTTIILETPSDKRNDITLNFTKILYKGNLDDNLDLSIEIIKFSNNVEIFDIYLDGRDANFFKITENKSNILFELKTKLNEDDIQGRKYFECLIVVKTKSNIEFSAAILIDIPKRNNDNIIIPKFNKNIYNGQIISNTKIHLDIITLNNPIKNIEFEISGDGLIDKYFGIETNETDVIVIVSNPIPNNILQNNSYLSLILIAKVKNQLYDNFTTIILSTPAKNTTKPLEFTKILYKGLINETLKLRIEEIKFQNILKLKQIYIEGNDEKYFQVTATNELNILFQLKSDLNGNDIVDRKYFECMIVAETEDGILSRTVILIDIEIGSTNPTPTPTITTEPSTTLGSTNPTPTITTTTEPSTTSNPITTSPFPPSAVPKFEKNLYIFTIMPNQIGIFGIVKIDQSENIQIEYKLENIDEYPNARININKVNGELYLTSNISPGVYDFEATAKTNISSDLAKTNIRLQVNSINICGETTQVQSSLLIKNLEEEKIHYDILEMKQNNCMFEIISMNPKYEEYFRINDTTKMLNSIAIDREDPKFSNLHIVQIQLKLILNVIEIDKYIISNKYLNYNQIPNNQIQLFNNSIDERQYILTNDINFNPSVTYLSIIIDDINDNPPEFIIPLKSKIIIGYPDIELSDKILPEYLIQVNAIDMDIELNAKICYRILSPTSNHFGIDEKTGIIYPYSNALQNIDETTLNVYAIDRNGASDGLNTSIEIIVKKINSNHLVLLAFERIERIEITDILKNISLKIGLDLMNLNNAIVPSNGNSYNLKFFNNLFSRTSSTIVMKTWVYSFDDKNIPIDAGVLKEKISEKYENSDVKVERYEDTRNNNNLIDVTGYIVAISLLSVTCICFIGFLAWIYYFRQLIYRRFSSPSLDKLAPFNNSNSLEPNTVYQNQVEKNESPLSSYLKRESIKIVGTTTQETSSDYQQQLSEDESINDDILETESHNNDESLEKRKSIVTFNELVERIEIESDDEEDRKDSLGNSIRL